MRIVLDTNVFVSGVFFGGPPYQILKAWQDGDIVLLLSTEITEEYWRIAEELSARYPGVNFRDISETLMVNSELIDAPPLDPGVCEDPDDDKFIACALAGRAACLVSGDRHLLVCSGYSGLAVLRPAAFIAKHLSRR